MKFNIGRLIGANLGVKSVFIYVLISHLALEIY